MDQEKKVAILHGAGYVGGELLRLVAAHPALTLAAVTSRAFAGEPVWRTHPHLRGQIEAVFTGEDDLSTDGLDAVFVAAEHGKGVAAVQALLASGYEGLIVDLSADFRFRDASLYEPWFGFTHPAPELISSFAYGLAEVNGPYAAGTKYVANPGCFATGIALALWPVARHVPGFHAAVTALTGASGSGARPKETTHYPTRDGNVRAYKVFAHQHLPEIQQVVGAGARLSFTPASGPWTRGIWGTAHVTLPDGTTGDDVAAWYDAAYGHRPLVRLWGPGLPELRTSVGSPFCDIGWVVQGTELVVGFGLDNLLKGAASQAVQNLNLLMGLPETTGLVPSATLQPAALP